MLHRNRSTTLACSDMTTLQREKPSFLGGEFFNKFYLKNLRRICCGKKVQMDKMRQGVEGKGACACVRGKDRNRGVGKRR